jgi:predicted GIY-YIG superfamily endonuclease
MSNKPSYVYLLLNDPKKSCTYVGATVDLDQRLRRHNKEIVGGAKATGRKVNKERGEKWVRAAHVEGFPTWQAALQFEWRWKQLTRKYAPPGPPLQRRMYALQHLLSLERPTSKAVKYSEWPTPPRVVIEIEGVALPAGLQETVVPS